MSQGRHSYVEFYPSDWIGGTARMTRMQRAIYFDVCCYCWDKAEECPPEELPLMLGDIEGWERLLDQLVAAKKLYRTAAGSVGNSRAMEQATKARDLWERKSLGGKRGADKTNSATPGGSPVGSADGSGGDSGDGTGPGVPPQNQNQNQNQNHLGDAQYAPSKPKRERKVQTSLPADCPTEADRNAAARYWRDRGREDLCARLGDEVEAFRAHHAAHGKRMADWSAAWKTWYGNAMRFQAKPKGSKPVAAPGAQIGTDETGWKNRIALFRAQGKWSTNWGPNPNEPGCQCPPHILGRKDAA